MLFVVNKIVEAKSAEEAIKKSKRIPVTECFIHNGSWERNDFNLSDKKRNPIGFEGKNASKKRPKS